MKKYIAFIAFSLLSTQLLADVDCKMFMSAKDRVVVLEKKNCHVVADNSIKDIGEVDMCLAKIKTANGNNIVRVVAKAQREDRFNQKKLFIVEKLIKDITSDKDQLFFTQDYFNTANLERTRYNVQLSLDLSSIHLKVAEGRFSLEPHYDLSFECH